MKLYSFNPGRYLRLALLMLLLAAQGIGYAHEIGHLDSVESGLCATCSIGNGLGAGVTVSHAAPEVQVCHALIPVHSIAPALVSRTNSHFARAPPHSL